MPDEGGDVVAHRLEGQRAVHVPGAAVSLQVDRYHPALAGQRRQDRGGRLARGVAAVQQDKRLARAVLVVVQGNAVHVRVAHRITDEPTVGAGDPASRWMMSWRDTPSANRRLAVWYVGLSSSRHSSSITPYAASTNSSLVRPGGGVHAPNSSATRRGRSAGSARFSGACCSGIGSANIRRPTLSDSQETSAALVATPAG